MKIRSIFPFGSTIMPLSSVGTVEQQIDAISQFQANKSINTNFATESNLLGIPAHNKCADFIAHAVAMMLASADVYDDAGNLYTDRFPIIRKPTGSTENYAYFYSQILALLIYGNAFCVKTDDRLVPVHPVYVHTRIDEQGRQQYEIGGMELHPDQVFHVKGFGLPGWIRGQGVIERFSTSITNQLNEIAYGGGQYTSGAAPSIVVTLAGNQISKESLDNIKAGFDGRAGGARTTTVVLKDMQVTPIQWTPQDMQFIAARQFSVAEIAYIWGLDPSDLGASVGNVNQTYANISQRDVTRLTYSFAQWLIRFEQAMTTLLPDGYHVKGNAEAILRTDAETRARIDDIKLGNGTLTKDEARAHDNLKPLGDAA